MKFYNQEQFLKNGMIQEVIWIEELGELQHEITKSLRGMPNKTHIVEEFADVLICLEQLKIKYNISDEQLQEWIDYKYNRNLNRLEQKQEVTKEKDNITFNIEAFEKCVSDINRSLNSGITIYKETIKIIRLEYEILKWLDKRGYKFIVRSPGGNLMIYYSTPKRDDNFWFYNSGSEILSGFNELFQFVQWKDKEPTSIQDVLENCEVADNDG